MTVTVKLDAVLEEQLRRRAAMTGCTTSEVIRSALQAYLTQPERAQAPSAFSLGQDLFGKHRGPSNLAARRKQALAEAVAERHQRRGR